VYCAEERLPSYADNPGDRHTPCNDTTFSGILLRSDYWSRNKCYLFRSLVVFLQHADAMVCFISLQHSSISSGKVLSSTENLPPSLGSAT